MFLRILLLAIISLQVSGCLITPRFQSNIVDDYEPPVKETPKEVVEQPKPQLSEQVKEEIRKQVKEEVALQNEAAAKPKPKPKSTKK